MGRKNYPSVVKCYNCGILIPDEEKTWEHVPMDSLYKGLQKKINVQELKCVAVGLVINNIAL